MKKKPYTTIFNRAFIRDALEQSRSKFLGYHVGLFNIVVILFITSKHLKGLLGYTIFTSGSVPYMMTYAYILSTLCFFSDKTETLVRLHYCHDIYFLFQMQHLCCTRSRRLTTGNSCRTLK